MRPSVDDDPHRAPHTAGEHGVLAPVSVGHATELPGEVGDDVGEGRDAVEAVVGRGPLVG